MYLKKITYLAQDPGHFNTILMVHINIYFSEVFKSAGLPHLLVCVFS